MTLTYRVLTGAVVTDVLDDLARLRIAVFRDWPYLYDGSMDYERGYMASYADKPGAILVAAFDGARIVGASTGTPMEDHADDFQAGLSGAGLDEHDIFYCAESVLLPQYRGQGAGRVFFREREKHARTLGRKFSAFAGVIRPTNHPLRPRDYRPLDAFWQAIGYERLPGAVAQFTWKDVDQDAPSAKDLQFWMKRL